MQLLRLVAIASSAAAALVLAEPLKGKIHLAVTDSQPPVAQPNVKYYAHVVADGDECDYPDMTMPMCANKDFVCRMEPGQEMFATAPSCLAYDPSNMQDNPFEIEETAVAPWGNCDPVAEMNRKMGDPPVCKREFQCLCLHGAGQNCVCAPADAVEDASGATKCGNATTTCTEDKYCHYLQEGGMECGQKPYFS
ncbi:hypothetical protein PHYSODRAFT_312679 [Phytophthora sojae]|uniref:Cysteine-rich protein n=1 Tax=Phytophthora sojae (strain P6497) TaxID=1094619 RepID=G4Z5V2_PHYSP|nr:hypothetical protein PHYSODRAFT_312679 [Phytophthora sojae]EGZ19535.1 hypothetical protein PHYSODRAFT_312679 [Phytophthora sojae]|eukprot:XP_009522252.1 hypothetical protein PHYSODRAFT_312679 [Phytophthora sojae]